MNEYTPIIYFIAGVVQGLIIFSIGLYLGFKASYDIRNHKEGVYGNTDGNLRTGKDGVELTMLDEMTELDKELDEAEEEAAYNSM